MDLCTNEYVLRSSTAANDEVDCFAAPAMTYVQGQTTLEVNDLLLTG